MAFLFSITAAMFSVHCLLLSIAHVLQCIALLLYTQQIYHLLLLIIVLVTFDSLVFLAYFFGAVTVYLVLPPSN